MQKGQVRTVSSKIVSSQSGQRSGQRRERKRRKVAISPGLSSQEESFERADIMQADTESMDDQEKSQVFTSVFMDKIDVCWEEIVDRIINADFWKNREESLNQMDSEIQELKEENANLRKRLKHTEGRLTRTEKELEVTKEKVIDLTARSMRDNLIFKNVEESRGENVEEKVMRILQTKLNITDERIEIHRAHRVGKYNTRYTRNIVVCFTSKSKATIMKHLKNLPKEDVIKIQEQFPPEVHMRRSKLWPQFIHAKQNNHEARFNMDRLIVNNKVINPPKDKVADINLDVTSKAMSMTAKHTPVSSTDNNHYQGHTIPVTCADDVVPAIRALCSEQRVAGSSHLVYAYRIGHEGSYLSNFEDDGEWGGGREVMKVMDEHKLFNQIVAVTRWNGGRMIGPSRFKHIRETAEKAVSSLVE
jgi:hypothetical protein